MGAYGGLMSDWDALKASLAFRVLPENIQHIGIDFAIDDLQPLQMFAVGSSFLTVDPDRVLHDRLLGRQNAFDRLESNMYLGRPGDGRFLIFEKHRKNLNALKRLL